MCAGTKSATYSNIFIIKKEPKTGSVIHMQCVAQALNLHLSYKNHNKRFDLMFDYLCVPCVQIKSNNLGRRNSEAGEKKVEIKEETLLWVLALFLWVPLWARGGSRWPHTKRTPQGDHPHVLLEETPGNWVFMRKHSLSNHMLFVYSQKEFEFPHFMSS